MMKIRPNIAAWIKHTMRKYLSLCKRSSARIQEQKRESANFGKRTSIIAAILSAILIISCSTLTNEDRFDTGKENFLASNFDQSFKQLLPIAKQGNPEAQYAIGYMYFYGLGTKQNMREAVNWMQQAAESGQPQAQLALRQLQQDQIVTSRAFSSSGQSADYRNRSGGNAAANHSADVPEQLTATWPQPALSVPTMSEPAPVAEPMVSSPVQDNPIDDLHSSAKQQQPQLATILEKSNTAITNDIAELSGRYTVQLMGAYTQDTLENFAKNLSISPDQYRIVHTQRDSRDWFVLMYGDYPNMASALEAKRNLPDQLQVFNPWVRNFDQFKQGIA